MRTCARLGCREVIDRKGKHWCSDACRKAAGRDLIQGTIPKDWPRRSFTFWEAMRAMGSRGRRIGATRA